MTLLNGNVLNHFIASILISLLFNSAAAETIQPVYENTKKGTCYGYAAGSSAADVANLTVELINSVATPCEDSTVVCTRPVTLDSISETSFKVKSACGNQAIYGHGIKILCPSGFSLVNSMCVNSCNASQVYNATLRKCVPANPSGFGGGPDNNNPNGCDGASKNPILFNTGNKVLKEVDYESRGLVFVRYYNHYLKGGVSLGASWMSDSHPLILNTKIQTMVLVVRPDGVKIPFYKIEKPFDVNEKIQWYASYGSIESDDVNTQGIIEHDVYHLSELRNGASRAGWILTDKVSGKVESYDATGLILSVVDPNGNGSTFVYSDGTNGVISGNGGYVLDDSLLPTGSVLPANLLLRVTNAYGRSMQFGYDVNRRIVKMATPDDDVYKYTYDNNYNLASVVYPGGRVREYLYEDSSNIRALTGIIDKENVDAAGVRYASYWYDANGMANSEELASDINQGIDKYSIIYTTNENGVVVNADVTDPLGTLRTYNYGLYNGSTRSLGVNQPGGSGCSAASNQLSYDTHGNIVSRIDFNQKKTCYAYDMVRNLETARVEGLDAAASCSAALVATTYSGDIRKITTTWHSNYRLPLTITEPGRITTYAYDIPGKGYLLHTKTITDTATGKSRAWTYSYTEASDNTLVNLIKTIDGPRTDVNDVITYSYYTQDDVTVPPKYRRGDLWKVTNALNHAVIIAAYDGNGRPVSVVNANNVTTALEYWPRGWLKSQAVAGKTTSYEYNFVGKLSRLTYADGSYVNFEYDDAYRLTDITDTLQNRVHYTLDAIGNRVSEEIYDGAGNLNARKGRDFDALNRLWHDVAYFNDPASPVSTEYTYDAGGNLASATAPVNYTGDTAYRTTQYDYDALGRLRLITDPVNIYPVEFGYDALDQLNMVMDANLSTTSYGMNALGENNQLVSPDTRTTSYDYDDAGNLAKITDMRGITAQSYYDPLNRLINTTYSDSGEYSIYQWDSGSSCGYGVGRLCGVFYNGGDTDYTYDEQGNLLTETITRAGVNFVTQYSYDSVNRRYSITLPTGHTQVYTRNAAGQVVAILDQYGSDGRQLADQIHYDGNGRVTSALLGNGLALSYDFNLSGLPAGSSPLFANDNNGNITQRGDDTFSYDALGRLKTETRQGVTVTYEYDANGNRLSDAGGSYTYEPNSNRLQSRYGVTVTLDAAGNLIDDGVGHTYSYNARGQLTKVYSGGVLVATYMYNDKRQRIKKITTTAAPQGSQKFLYHYDDTGHLVAETDNLGNSLRSYVWNGDIPLAQIEHGASGDQVFYIEADYLNTPRLATDETGRVVWRWDSDAFGSTQANEDPDADGIKTTINLRFPGQYYDVETGLHYNWHRYYDPTMGRYITSDPIGLAGGVNTFAYVWNNPLLYVDPLGLDAQCTCVATGPTGYNGAKKICNYRCVCTSIDCNGKPNGDPKEVEGKSESNEQSNNTEDYGSGICKGQEPPKKQWGPPTFNQFPVRTGMQEYPDWLKKLLEEHGRSSAPHPDPTCVSMPELCRVIDEHMK